MARRTCARCNRQYILSRVDVMANYAWLRLANPDNPMEGLDEALGTIRELSALTLSGFGRDDWHFTTRTTSIIRNTEIHLLVSDFHFIK